MSFESSEKQMAMNRLVAAFNDLIALEVVNVEDKKEFVKLLDNIDCHVYVCEVSRAATKVGWR